MLKINTGRLSSSLLLLIFSLWPCLPTMAADDTALSAKEKVHREVPVRLPQRERAVTIEDYQPLAPPPPEISRLRSPAGTQGGAPQETTKPEQLRSPATQQHRDRIQPINPPKNQAPKTTQHDKRNTESEAAWPKDK